MDLISTKLYSVYVAAAVKAGNEDNEKHTIMDDDFIPDVNAAYKTKKYWDDRFSKEITSYDWLCTFQMCKDGFIKTGMRMNEEKLNVLVVGCGNSTFSIDLFKECPTWKITSIDFSAIVVQKMKIKHPELIWLEQDMTKMTFPDNTFDYIFDKAAMDALVADEGSSWDPSESSCKSVDDMVASCARVLKKHGKFTIVSFQPVHFRRKHLERAIAKCPEPHRFNHEIQINVMENLINGTEFAVFTLIKL